MSYYKFLERKINDPDLMMIKIFKQVWFSVEKDVLPLNPSPHTILLYESFFLFLKKKLLLALISKLEH